MSAPRVSIVIPAFNQLDYCRQCIFSIQAHTDLPYRLILVDNGSTDGVSEFFDSIPDATVIHTGENLGFAAGTNRGLAHAEGHVLLLNSDTIVPQGWLSRLQGALLSDTDIGLVGPMTNCASGSQQIDGLQLDSLEAINEYATGLAAGHGGRVRDVARLVGFCLLIRDKAFAQLGPLDESYGIGNYEDDDYCLRAIRAGWRLCVAEDSFVFHYGSRTFLGMGIVDEEWKSLIARNQQKFESKWSALPEERDDALQNSRILNRKARQAFDQGDTTGAVRYLKAAIEVAPAYELNYNDLGVILWQLGEHERAYENFLRALRWNPGYKDAEDNLNQAAAALGKPQTGSS
jgi:glycosyltransferase involved in cell wall biosynthesis